MRTWRGAAAPDLLASAAESRLSRSDGCDGDGAATGTGGRASRGSIGESHVDVDLSSRGTDDFSSAPQMVGSNVSGRSSVARGLFVARPHVWESGPVLPDRPNRLVRSSIRRGIEARAFALPPTATTMPNHGSWKITR
jgi:hypothetical protein